MEQNLPIITKKLWNIMRLAYFMLRKGICKKKILLDINLMMKRGKLATKVALNNLIFHHYRHHNRHVSASHSGVGTPSINLEFISSPVTVPQEYEFSCKNTPLYRNYFKSKKKNYRSHENYYYYMSSSPTVEHTNDGLEAINKVLDIMGSDNDTGTRQLRITDSPYPLQNGEDNHYVDEAAEAFIQRFYSQLKKQDC